MMFPASAEACLAHIRNALTSDEYETAIARIEQLVAAQCAIAQREIHEALERQAVGRLAAPLSKDKAQC